MVENLPANAGDMGSSPGLGGSHMPQSNWACEPQLLSLRVWSLCSATRETAIVKRPMHCDEEWPLLAATRESPRTERGGDNMVHLQRERERERDREREQDRERERGITAPERIL